MAVLLFEALNPAFPGAAEHFATSFVTQDKGQSVLIAVIVGLGKMDF